MRWRTEAFDRQTGSVPHQGSKSEQMWAIEFSSQVNSPAAGGARTCGNGADCVQDTLPRWASVFSMTALSSIAAISGAAQAWRYRRRLGTSVHRCLGGPVEYSLESLGLYAQLYWVHVIAT